MAAKTELISWQVLIDFFNEKIKFSPETYNSDKFQYPSEVTIQTLRNNGNKIRFHLLSHFISSIHDVDLSNKYIKKEISRAANYLKKPTFQLQKNSERNFQIRSVLSYLNKNFPNLLDSFQLKRKLSSFSTFQVVTVQLLVLSNCSC